jgi:hypothetical protein
MQTAAKWNILQLTNSTDHSTSWKANSSSPSQETPYLLCKPKGSLQCSQGPATDSYPKPDESSPHLHTLFL